MPLVYDERVRESSTIEGTGAITLDGPPDTTYHAFGDVMADGDTTDVSIFGAGGFESRRCEYDSGTDTLLRNGTIYNSSNGGAAVTFGAGTKTVIMTLPGELAQPLANNKLVRLDAAQSPTAIEQAQALANASASPLVHGNVLCPHKNLVVKFVTVATVDIDADAVVLFDSSGNGRRFAAINLTATMSGSTGANLLDTGAEASSTWYALWVVAKADGTIASLLSASFSAPTLPADYIYKGIVGAVYNSSGSDFVKFLQRGNLVWPASVNVLVDGAATTYTPIDLTALIPPNATSLSLNVQPKTSSGTATVLAVLAPAGSGTTDTYGGVAIGAAGATTTVTARLFVGDLIIETPQQIVYWLSGTNARATFELISYKF